MVAFLGKSDIFPNSWWHFQENRRYFQVHGGIFKKTGNISKDMVAFLREAQICSKTVEKE